MKWSLEEDENLKKEYQAGKDIQELANIFHRKKSAIESQLKKLGLMKRLLHDYFQLYFCIS